MTAKSCACCRCAGGSITTRWLNGMWWRLLVKLGHTLPAAVAWPSGHVAS